MRRFGTYREVKIMPPGPRARPREFRRWRSVRGWGIVFGVTNMRAWMPTMMSLNILVPAPSGRKFRLANGMTLEHATAILAVHHA